MKYRRGGLILSAVIYGYLQCSPSLINLIFFLRGGGGALRLEGFIKCLELPFNVEKFKKQRTPDLSKQGTCRSSCGWNHIFLLHLSNSVAGREPEAYRLNLHSPWNRRGQSHLLSYRKESK